MSWLDQTVNAINERRLNTYLGQCAQYPEVARQDVANGLPPRPFPELPRAMEVRRDPETGAEFDAESNRYVCAAIFTWEKAPDGLYRIKTNVPIGLPTQPLRG